MKQKLGFFSLFALLLTLFLPTAAAAKAPVQLALYDSSASCYVDQSLTAAAIRMDGELLESDLPPFLYQGRTMVPVRLLAERLSASVEWVESARQVHIWTADREIVLTIGSPTALVNGEPTLLPDGVSAMMARRNGIFRTMVPLRFVSEYLGAQVEWDSQSYTALVTSPSVPFHVTGVTADDNAQTVFLATEGTPRYILQDFGDRAVVDLPGGILTSEMPASLLMENEIFSAVRWAGHTDLYPNCASSVRVVLDLRPGFTCNRNVTVSTVSGGVLIQTTRDSSAVIPLPSVPINPAASTIVLDAGHGGDATGAQYEGIREKDINLSVTRKLAVLLENCGYNVILTRYGDQSVGLYERADIANGLNADIFVSLHSNAAPAVPDYAGIYTYHFPESRRGSLLAQFIQNAIVPATGAIDRGTRSADFVVLRETGMAAVLVEMGFMTNHDELMLLIDNGYQDRLAQGIANGIIQYLNSQKQ